MPYWLVVTTTDPSVPFLCRLCYLRKQSSRLLIWLQNLKVKEHRRQTLSLFLHKLLLASKKTRSFWPKSWGQFFIRRYGISIRSGQCSVY